jgi:hypothetical protein
MRLRSTLVLSFTSLVVVALGACASPPPEAPMACPKCPEAPPPPPPPAPPPPPPACPSTPAASATPAPPPAPPPPPPIGKAQGGPTGTRSCEFRESVDTYPRKCTITQEPDGALKVTAKGTSLNPDNGFTFRMGGGPNTFDAAGQLDAFGICKGPFAGKVGTVIDGKAKTYEIRFKDHCMIVIR